MLFWFWRQWVQATSLRLWLTLCPSRPVPDSEISWHKTGRRRRRKTWRSWM